MTMKINGTNGLLQNYDYQTPTTGFSYTFTTANFVVLNPVGTLATGTIITPASPADGMTITVVSTQQISALTFSANTGQTVVGTVTNLAANQTISYVYRLTNATWYPAGGVEISYGGPRAQLFTTTGAGQTFTIPSGTTQLKVTVVSGGGGSGGVPSSTCSIPIYGRSGGPGAMGVSWLTGLTPGNTISVTVGAGGTAGTSGGGNGGAGGTSSVSSGTQTITTITATGGAGGLGNQGTSAASTGGTSTGAQINTSGQSVQTSSGNNYIGMSPYGVGSAYGRGAPTLVTTNPAAAGSAGTQGIVIFEY